MKHVPLWFPLVLALLWAIYGLAILPDVHLSSFAPFFAITFQRKGFIKSLWICLFSGLLMDCLSSQFYFGTHGFLFLIGGAVCFSQKKHFFEEKIHSICAYTASISIIHSLLFVLLSYLIGGMIQLNMNILFSEILLTPILDALYAFVWFTIPMKLYRYIQLGNWKRLFKQVEEETE